MLFRVLVFALCVCALAPYCEGKHKKVIIHVPLYVKHHNHKHTIVKHIHHHHKGGGGDDHYEVLGYTVGEPKHSAPHFGGGHGWHAADEGGYDDESPTSFGGDDGGTYSLADDNSVGGYDTGASASAYGY